MEEIQEGTPTTETQPAEIPAPGQEGAAPLPEEQQGLQPRQILGITVAVTVLLIVVVLSMYGMVSHPILTSILRDISIIVLALVTIIIGLFMIVLIFQLQSLIVLLRDEVKPILESANQTANTMRGTTTFVSDAVVTPMIAAASYVSAVRQAIAVLFGGNRRRKTRQAQPPQPAPPPPPDPEQI